jgi:hypothetical protein
MYLWAPWGAPPRETVYSLQNLPLRYLYIFSRNLRGLSRFSYFIISIILSRNLGGLSHECFFKKEIRISPSFRSKLRSLDYYMNHICHLQNNSLGFYYWIKIHFSLTQLSFSFYIVYLLFCILTQLWRLWKSRIFFLIHFLYYFYQASSGKDDTKKLAVLCNR